jgi:hypothetical protein
LSASDDSLLSISAQRHTEPAKLKKQIRGELDWIEMKAMENDRTRRYETTSGFARDIPRYLEGDTVEACPPSASYRLRKLARKHRAALASVSALLSTGAAVSTWQAFRATRAERSAVAEALRAAREAQRAGAAERETPSRFDTQSRLGAGLVGQPQYAEAEPLLLAGFLGLKARQAQMPAQQRSRLPEAGRRLIQLYEVWGKPQNAREWQAKLTLPTAAPSPIDTPR